jgi:hypothetical protein
MVSPFPSARAPARVTTARGQAVSSPISMAWTTLGSRGRCRIGSCKRYVRDQQATVSAALDRVDFVLPTHGYPVQFLDERREAELSPCYREFGPLIIDQCSEPISR